MANGIEQIQARTIDTILDNRVKLTTSDNAPVDNENPFPVETPPVISAVNSSTDPLAADGTFNGVGEAINGYGIIYVNVFTDTTSSTDGLKIFQSSDNTHWDHCDEYTVPANQGKNFSINPYAAFLRINYTNGTTPQTVFRLQTIYKVNGKPSSHRIADPIIDDDDAELVKSVITGKDPSGDFLNANLTVDGDQKISDNSNGFAIAKGDVSGTSGTNKFGNAPDFDTGDGEVDVWDAANDAVAWQQMNYTFSSSADIDRISSSDNGDTQDIEIEGLDANYDIVVQTITLTGQTPVALNTSLIRVFRMKNVGSTNVVGYVFCFVNVATTNGIPNTPANIRAVIDNGNNQTEMAIYTVPAGKTGYIREIYASTAGGSRATNYIIKLKIRTFGQVFQLKHRRAINDDKDLEKKFDVPEIATEKSDIIVTAQTAATAISESSLSAGFDIVLVDN
jgi:hypothetical protein